MTCEPTFLGYQLLGDSQLLRFSKRFSTLPRRKLRDFSVGLCVSGQKIENLLSRIRNNESKISENLILMIGTNDILQKTEFERMTFFMDRILLQLIKDGAKRIILLTLPPIPKLNCCGSHWKTLKKFNDFIRKRHNGEDIFVLDAYTRFIETSPDRLELKPLGLSQHLNRINSSSDAKEYNEKQHSSSEDDSSLTTTNNLDELNFWLQKCSYVYNPMSDYVCDNYSTSEVKGDRINLQFFETHFEKNDRIDLIHLNILGLEQIKELIVSENYVIS